MQRIPFLNGFHLKLIAICTMFIDHLGYTLFPGDLWLRCVGRVAFPIFCFLIAEGCVYTHDRRKYALRLLAFALLSEIPFNLMNSGAVWDSYHQNVLWTLLTGALVCWLIDWALKNRRALAFVLTALVMGQPPSTCWSVSTPTTAAGACCWWSCSTVSTVLPAEQSAR